jgi:hypothetical protein
MDQYFTNLYTTDLDAELTPSTSKPKKFDGTINSKFHESTPILLLMENHVLPRNNYLDGKKGKDGNKITFNQIIQSFKMKNGLM